ncbi:MAG TPA: AAA family ATPase, partial [Polyangia bacterium]
MDGVGPVAPQVTARFELLRELGTGGMGVVYEAHDRALDVRVALKTLKRVSPDALLRLKDEFRELQDLPHPNLVSLGDLCEEGGLWFFTMELVEGVDFVSYVRPPVVASDSPARPDAETTSNDPASTAPRRAAVRAGELHEPRLRGALRQLAQGLASLHAGRKVHRDIKPSNVRVTLDGRVVVLDFGLVTGIAAAPEGRVRLVGTIDYMAPEQAARKPVGPPADWYAVGVMLYQALTGQLPFDGTAAEVVVLKQESEPLPPRVLAPGVPHDLDALCCELLLRDPDLRPTGAAILERLGAAAGEAGAAAAPDPLPATRFVGREEELHLLRHAFTEARWGGVAVLVEGDAGVGKTALARRFADDAAAGSDALVLWGRCSEHESMPYRGVDGVVDALSRHLARLPDDEAAALVPPQAGLLGQVFPVLRRVRALAAAPVGAEPRDPQEQRVQLFAGVRALLARLAERRRVVLVIDDLQWADADSRALLAELLRPPDQPPVLLLGTVRVAETGAGEGDAPAPVPLGAAETRRLRLGRLSRGEAHALAEALLAVAPAAARPSAAAIADEADGHPLFVHELVRHSTLPGAPTTLLRLGEALWNRISALPPGPRDVLELCALARAPLPVSAVASAAGVDPTDARRAVGLLRLGHLVRMTGGRGAGEVEPYHDRVRDAVLAHLGDGPRRAHHHRLALALERAGAAPQTLAAHWSGAGENDQAAAYAVQAADRAEEALAFDVAARMVRMALDLLPRDHEVAPGLRVRLGEVLANAGRGAEAAAAFLAAVPGADPEAALDLKRRATEQLLRSGRIDEGRALAADVLAACGLHLPRSPARALGSLLLRRGQLRARGLGFTARDAAEVPRAELIRIDVCWSVGVALAVVDAIVAMALQQRTLVLALHAGEPWRLTRALALCACNRVAEGRPSRGAAERLARAAKAVAAQAADPLATAWVWIA